MFIPFSENRVIRPDEVGDLYDEEDYIIQSYDPGGTTGWAMMAIHKAAIRRHDVLIIPNISWWTAGELTGSEYKQANEMASGAFAWPRAHLVVEDFILQKFSPARDLLAPVRVTARFQQAIGDRPIVFQMPSLAMTAVTDERQKEWGFWVVGSEHARVSVKHTLVWAQRAKKIVQSRTRAR